MLKPKELELLKTKIEKKLKYLIVDIEDLKELTKPIPPENSLGRITRMDAISKKGVNEAALRLALKTQTKLQLAITRINRNDATFGQCSNCEDYIPFLRLLAMPQSEYCINCAN